MQRSKGIDHQITLLNIKASVFWNNDHRNGASFELLMLLMDCFISLNTLEFMCGNWKIVFISFTHYLFS